MQVGVTTHSWWTFEAFAGRNFRYFSDGLNDILNAPDWEAKLERNWRAIVDKGVTHLVVDYLLWTRLKGPAIERFRTFVRENPPTFMIPNPVAKHYETLAEDSALPDLSEEPLAHHIYIWRLLRGRKLEKIVVTRDGWRRDSASP